METTTMGLYRDYRVYYCGLRGMVAWLGLRDWYAYASESDASAAAAHCKS